jgi:hypothetical protein
LGTGMFLGVGAKPVTVKVPSDADAWNDKTGTFTGVENKDDGPHWGEGFRGLGWYPNGSGYRYDGVLNTNITVNIETYEP